jgi:hypothetical protein
VGGQFNANCEKQYALIEGEQLGIALMLHKSHYLILGSPDVNKLLINFLDYVSSKEDENCHLVNLHQKMDNYQY